MKKTFRLALLLAAAFYFIIPFYSFSGDQDVLTNTITITEVNPNARTTYDLQSLGSSHMIEMNPNNVQEMHACFMVSTDPGPTYTNRNIRYFYTSNGGTTWDYIGPLTNTRGGFPVIDLTNDGRAVIMGQFTGIGNSGSYIFIDAGITIGNWAILDPGSIQGNPAVNPKIAVNYLNKIFFTASGYKNKCSGITPPGAFLGYSVIDNLTQPVISEISVSPSGKIGIAYITESVTDVPPGSVKFIESTNDGITFSAPLNVWIANYQSDSLAALRGLDCAYIGDSINVVFEVCKRTPEGSYLPRSLSKIIFWSPFVNNGLPVTVDEAPGLNGSNTINDVFTSVSRPVISYAFGNGQRTYTLIAYSKARTDTNIIGNNFYDLYSSKSSNKGLTWITPTQLTNNAGPLRDYRYLSVSAYNIYQAQKHIFNFIAQQDSIPGSSINGAPQSLAKMVYIKLQINDPEFPGVIPINSEIPNEFSLRQNYPNPFNPVTQIEFGVPNASNVKIKIYDSIGSLISVVAENRFVPGNYKADFDASNLSSGVYYYILEYSEVKTGKRNFISKKMVLIK